MTAQQGDQRFYTEQSFLGHLGDAILLCELAERLPRSSLARHGTLARASVMSAAFCLEAAANALLFPVEAPGFLLKKADGLPILDKFEFVLFAIRPDSPFERGSKHPQEVGELFDIRNRLVHARPRTRPVTHRDLGDGAIQISKKERPTNHLKLPQSPEDWKAPHALRVLRAVSDFLDYFVLDTCEMTREESAAVFLSRISLDGKQGLVLSNKQRHYLARALERWPIDFRLLRTLAVSQGNPEESRLQTLKLEGRYSWGAGGVQVHDNRLLIEIEAEGLSNSVAAEAVARFFMWFEEAQAIPFGRSLIRFELFSEEESRLIEYTAFLPDWTNPPSPVSEERQMGLVHGVTHQFFANGIVSVELEKDTILITFLLEDGGGRVLSLSELEAEALSRLIAMNRRSNWKQDDSPAKQPHSVQTKGRDYVVVGIEIFAYDPTSRTAFLTYHAASGRRVQINTKTSTAMKLHHEIEDCLDLGRVKRDHSEPSDTDE